MMNVCSIDPCHMTKMAMMPMYSKNLKKSSSLEPTLLIHDTVIVDLSNVRVYFIQICMYILHKTSAVSGE